MRSPGHYDELKRQSSAGVPELEAQPPSLVATTTIADTPALPAIDATWEAREAGKRAELAEKVEAGRLTRQEAVYQERAFDSQNLAQEKAAAALDAQREERARAIDQQATENTQKLVEQARTMGELHTRFETLGQNPIDLVDAKLHERFDDKHDPTKLYREALKEQRDDKDPYGTLERTALAENAAFQRDQQALADRIANADTLTARNELQLQKDAEAADYLSSTSHRIADQSEIITGSSQTEEAITYRERGEAYREESQDLRDTYRNRTNRFSFPEERQESDQATVRNASNQSEGKSDEASSSGTRKADEPAYSDPNIEMTDAKVERLSRLEGGTGLSEQHSQAGHSQPRRPVSGGAEI